MDDILYESKISDYRIIRSHVDAKESVDRRSFTAVFVMYFKKSVIWDLDLFNDVFATFLKHEILLGSKSRVTSTQLTNQMRVIQIQCSLGKQKL